MKITRLVAHILRVPASKAVALPIAGSNLADRRSLNALIVQIETNEGLSGIGFGQIGDGGSSLVSAIADDLAPILVGEDPLNHERLWAKSRMLDSPAAHRAYGLIDVALWDLKGKAAGMPLWRLWGGARESARAFTAETAPSALSADDTIGIARAAMANSVKGVRVGVRGIDPESESRKVVTVRDAIGEDVWFAVTVESRFDYETALPMGRFLEEEIGADWFEDPLADDDLNGYSHLSAHTDTPLAVGSRFTGVEQFVRFIDSKTPVTFRPDVVRLGGITPMLRVIALAEAYRRPIFPRLLPEVGVHLACGLPSVQAVEYTPALFPFFKSPPKLVDGNLRPPDGPGLGLELNPDAVANCQIAAK